MTELPYYLYSLDEFFGPTWVPDELPDTRPRPFPSPLPSPSFLSTSPPPLFPLPFPSFPFLPSPLILSSLLLPLPPSSPVPLHPLPFSSGSPSRIPDGRRQTSRGADGVPLSVTVEGDGRR